MSKKFYFIFSISVFAILFSFIGCTDLLNPKTQTDINLNIDLSKIIKSARSSEDTQSSISLGENPVIKVAIYDAKNFDATSNSTENLTMITQAQASISEDGVASVKLNDIPVGIDAIVFAELSFSNGTSTEVVYAGNSDVFKVKPTDNKVSLVLMKVVVDDEPPTDINPPVDTDPPVPPVDDIPSEDDDKEDVLKEQVASVVISPASGDVDFGSIVTLSCVTENSSIFYKVGETSEYQKYTEDTKIEITTETVIFAYAICEGMLDSEITQASYKLYQYTLNFDTNGGTSVESNEIYFDGATINLERFSTTKENMEFDGWFTSPDFSVSSITSITFSQNFEGLNKEENSITLYAKWRDKNKVASVVISPTSGDVSLGTIVTLSCSTENSSIFYKVGETSDYQEYTEDTKIEITTETTIFAYAICEGMLDSEITQASYKLYQYTLNFDTNGGTSVESNEIYFDGATINLERFSTTKENMEFDGWFTSPDFSVSSITSITFSQNFEGLNKEENSITLYAKWRDKNKVASVVISPTSGDVSLGTIVTLSCSTENSSIFYKVGETSDYQEYTEDTKIEITTETTIFAYAICEGMLDSEITQATYTVPKSNITVTFPSYTEVEGLTINVTENSSTCSADIPAGYEFVAWYVDGEIFDIPSDNNILNYEDFNDGSHTIMLVVKYTDGNLYSVEAILKINEE